MISGILIALGTLASQPGQAELAAWLQTLAEAAPTELAFIESRSSDLLAEPLEVRGQLSREGDTLVRRTISPRRETQTLSATAIELRRDNRQRQRFAIRRAPELAALREALLAILDGDGPRLLEHFEARLNFDDEGGWQMDLKPRAEALAESVKELSLVGMGDRIDRMILSLVDGEQIVTRFEAEP